LRNDSGRNPGMLARVSEARSIRTRSGFHAMSWEVSSSLECQPGVSSGGFSMSPSRIPT
jgi:hypothetical protein